MCQNSHGKLACNFCLLQRWKPLRWKRNRQPNCWTTCSVKPRQLRASIGCHSRMSRYCTSSLVGCWTSDLYLTWHLCGELKSGSYVQFRNKAFSTQTSIDMGFYLVSLFEAQGNEQLHARHDEIETSFAGFLSSSISQPDRCQFSVI